jgi:hypothetical protein
MALPGPPAVSAFLSSTVKPSNLKLRGSHIEEREPTWLAQGRGQQPGEARQRLHQAGKVRLRGAPRFDELHEVGLARLKVWFRQASAK